MTSSSTVIKINHSDNTLDSFSDIRPLRFLSLRGRLAVSAFAILDLLLLLSLFLFVFVCFKCMHFIQKRIL